MDAVRILYSGTQRTMSSPSSRSTSWYHQQASGVDVAPLPCKTTVKLFDIPGIACANTGRNLINNVIECHDGEVERRACVALVTPTSQANAELVK